MKGEPPGRAGRGGRRGMEDAFPAGAKNPAADEGRERREPEQVLYVETPPVPGEDVRVAGAEAAHARTLRLRTGDRVHLVDGKGRRYPGRVVEPGKRALTVRVNGQERLPVWPNRQVWLGAGVLRSTRMDFLVEKASELGVTRLVPLLLRYCVARPHEDGAKQERWHRLAVESLKQSRRGRLLDVTVPMDLDGFLDALILPYTLWVADPEGSDPREAAAETGPGALALVVGPEGGMSAAEHGILERRGARFVRLGGHRLRAETAAVTLVAVALASLGEMGPNSSGV